MRESTRRGHALVNIAGLTGVVSIIQIRVCMSRCERWGYASDVRQCVVVLISTLVFSVSVENSDLS
ncbi:receptor-like protein kinase 5 [Dorcoceras hygrometricum]|uniref:Receptor-like protein kinase 5 n=1 Tax=Dorcoceras hygrometricum TaxID=472368 RepID=A0A2Z7CHU4_9LAMI|nr:receptor-like protein kinase 5 [Dorcoceras hygrometricum]